MEPGVTRAFLDIVRSGTVVYDVGAHLGYYTLLAARLGAIVHAFEPSPETLPLLRGNVAGKGTVVPQGLWDSPGRVELKDYGARHSAVNTFLESPEEAGRDPVATHRVEVTTIDHYVDSGGAVPDLIKIDAEGAETEVLRGGVETIRRHHPIITVEVGHSSDRAGSRRSIDFAMSLGYEPYEMTPAGTRQHVPKATYSYGNILLLPRRDVSSVPGAGPPGAA